MNRFPLSSLMLILFTLLPFSLHAATHDVVGNSFFSPKSLTLEVGHTFRWTTCNSGILTYDIPSLGQGAPQLLGATVLVFEVAQLFRARHRHTAKPGLPALNRLLRHVVLAHLVVHPPAGFVLFEKGDDLFFGKSLGLMVKPPKGQIAGKSLTKNGPIYARKVIIIGRAHIVARLLTAGSRGAIDRAPRPSVLLSYLLIYF